MTYIVLAYIAMTFIVMAYIVMACTVMACIVMAYIVMAYGLYSYFLYSYGLYLVVKTGGGLSSCVKPPTEAAQLLDRVVGSRGIGGFGWHTRSRSVTMPLRFSRPEPRRQTDGLAPHDGVENALWRGVFAS